MHMLFVLTQSFPIILYLIVYKTKRVRALEYIINYYYNLLGQILWPLRIVFFSNTNVIVILRGYSGAKESR